VFQVNSDRNQLVVNSLKTKFTDAVEQDEVASDILVIMVNKAVLYDVLLFLQTDDQLKYNFLTTLCGMHYPEKEQLGVVYHLHSFINNHRIRIKTVTDIRVPSIPTITSLWPAANWMERETYDFYGILFEGHPHLERILNVDDMVGFPLRKGFPLEDQTREDKDNSLFGR